MNECCFHGIAFKGNDTDAAYQTKWKDRQTKECKGLACQTRRLLHCRSCISHKQSSFCCNLLTIQIPHRPLFVTCANYLVNKFLCVCVSTRSECLSLAIQAASTVRPLLVIMRLTQLILTLYVTNTTDTAKHQACWYSMHTHVRSFREKYYTCTWKICTEQVQEITCISALKLVFSKENGELARHSWS